MQLKIKDISKEENWEKYFDTEIVFCIMHIHRNINENIGKNFIITIIYHILAKELGDQGIYFRSEVKIQSQNTFDLERG